MIEVTPEATLVSEKELKAYEADLVELKNLVPSEIAANKLRTVEIPELEGEVKKLEVKLDVATSKAEKVSSNLLQLKSVIAC